MLSVTVIFIIVLLVCCAKVQSVDKNQVLQKCSQDNNMDLKRLIEIRLTEKDPEKLPHDFLCTSNCAWELMEVVKDGKPNMAIIKADKFLLSTMKDENQFLRCVSDIDSIKKCDDARKMFRCTHQFEDSFLEACIRETNMDQEKFMKWHEKLKNGEDIDATREILCLKKCVSEKKKITDEGGVLTKYEVEKCEGI